MKQRAEITLQKLKYVNTLAIEGSERSPFGLKGSRLTALRDQFSTLPTKFVMVLKMFHVPSPHLRLKAAPTQDSGASINYAHAQCTLSHV